MSKTKKKEEALQKLQWSFHWSVSTAIIPMVAIAGNKPMETEVERRMGKETVEMCVCVNWILWKVTNVIEGIGLVYDLNTFPVMCN